MKNKIKHNICDRPLTLVYTLRRQNTAPMRRFCQRPIRRCVDFLSFSPALGGIDLY